MHPTTAQYLVNVHREDLEREAAKVHLAASVRRDEPGEPRPMRWGIRLPRLVRALRGGPAAGATTA